MNCVSKAYLRAQAPFIHVHMYVFGLVSHIACCISLHVLVYVFVCESFAWNRTVSTLIRNQSPTRAISQSARQSMRHSLANVYFLLLLFSYKHFCIHKLLGFAFAFDWINAFPLFCFSAGLLSHITCAERLKGFCMCVRMCVCVFEHFWGFNERSLNTDVLCWRQATAY